MNYYLSLLFKALKVGTIFNIITAIWAAIYVFCAESYWFFLTYYAKLTIKMLA